MPPSDKIIRVIREFWQPQSGGYEVNSEFSSDGRYLLVTWGNRIGALLFDTGTWQPVTDPRLFPQNLKEYLHTPDWSFGIAVTDSGETLVWDWQAHRIVSKLPGFGEFEAPPVVTDQQGHRVYTEPSAEIWAMAFSPDRARVAVFGGPNDVYRLRLNIFDVRRGDKELDLWPVEWMSYPIGQPLWWNGGQWLIAPYSGQFSPGGTGVWDAETGRFLGTLDLSGCKADVSPALEGTRLLQSCTGSDGKQDKLLEWTLDSVYSQLKSAARPFALE